MPNLSPPTILSSGGAIGTSRQHITGEGDAGTTILLTDGYYTLDTATVQSDGSWQASVILADEGAHAVVATESDASGNISAASSAVNYQLTTPVLNITLNSNLTDDTESYNASGNLVISAADGAHVIAQGTTQLTFNDGTVSLLPEGPEGLVDPLYYYMNNHDVWAAHADAAEHYDLDGWKEGRNPSAVFSTKYYLVQNPDVAAADTDPLLHFAIFGWKEGRDPSYDFSLTGYLAANPSVVSAGIDPLADYLLQGRSEGNAIFAATPHVLTAYTDPLVDPAYIAAIYPTYSQSGLDASDWYHQIGWQQDADPNADFDASYYVQQYHPNGDPLLDYEQSGYAAGRNPNPLFDSAWYIKTYNLSTTVNPLSDYMNGGWQAGRSPSPYLNVPDYEAANPDVAAAQIDPLVHFEIFGWRESRDPSPGFSSNYYSPNAVTSTGVNSGLYFIEQSLNTSPPGSTASNLRTFSGVATAGAILELGVVVNASTTTPIQSAVADVNGNWSITVPSDALGLNTAAGQPQVAFRTLSLDLATAAPWVGQTSVNVPDPESTLQNALGYADSTTSTAQHNAYIDAQALAVDSANHLDATSDLQALLNQVSGSGITTVYIPKGEYILSHTVTVQAAPSSMGRSRAASSSTPPHSSIPRKARTTTSTPRCS